MIDALESRVDNMNDRILTLEHMVGQILTYLQQMQTINLIDPQGAAHQGP